jgi:hypothetical protein
MPTEYDLDMVEGTCMNRHKTLVAMLHGVEKALINRIDGIDKATDVKTKELDRRLEGLNELRSEVIKDRDQLVQRNVYTSKMQTIEERLRELADSRGDFVRNSIYEAKMGVIDDWIVESRDKLGTLMNSYNARINLIGVLATISTLLSLISAVYLWTHGGRG